MSVVCVYILCNEQVNVSVVYVYILCNEQVNVSVVYVCIYYAMNRGQISRD